MHVEQKKKIFWKKTYILDLDSNVLQNIFLLCSIRKKLYLNLFISKQFSYSQFAQQNLNEPRILSQMGFEQNQTCPVTDEFCPDLETIEFGKLYQIYLS